MNHKIRYTGLCVLISMSLLAKAAVAEIISINNAGFEDTSGQTVFNEFTFGVPVGWTLYDPNNVSANPGIFIGTLQPNGTDFFTQTAPEGNRVGLLFGSGGFGGGEYGFSQNLGVNLSANTRYELNVDVGDIDSGIATNGVFFNLEEFPGYRIELLAGGQVIAQDNNTQANTFVEGVFSTVTLSFTADISHALLGQELGIRLINLNEIPAGFNAGNSPDLEVDFDNVQLTATVVPLPASLPLFVSACLLLSGWQISLRRRLISR